MVAEELVETEITYGMGATCRAILPKRRVEGVSARDLISTVIDAPQSSDPARRAARVLKEVVGSGRSVDVEVSRSFNGERTENQPVLLDDVVLRTDKGVTPVTEKIAIQVSEPYVGG